MGLRTEIPEMPVISYSTKTTNYLEHTGTYSMGNWASRVPLEAKRLSHSSFRTGFVPERIEVYPKEGALLEPVAQRASELLCPKTI